MVPWSRRKILALAAAMAAWAWAAPSVAQTTGGFSQQLDQAQQKLDADIKACRPINVSDYLQLQAKATANLKTAEKAKKAGLPVNVEQLGADMERATQLLERAQTAAEKQKAACQPPNQSSTTGKPPENPPPPPPPPPTDQGATSGTGGGIGPPLPPIGGPVSAEAFIAFAEEEAEDAFDDYVDAALHCDAKGMQDALNELKELEKKAEEIRDAAQMAGKYSKISVLDADAVYEHIHAIVLDTPRVKLRCPLLPQPKPQLPGPCPAPKEQPKGGTSPQSMNFGGSPIPPPDRTSQGLLDYQNELRSYVGMPPLRWNTTLAMHAMDYATQLSETGQAQHSSRTGREQERENLAVGPRGSGSAMSLAMAWGNELQYFRPGKFPNSCQGDWSRCGHITQILWGTTTDVGCGYASGRYVALVCRYSPPGNRDGTYVLRLPAGWPCNEADRRTYPERGE